MNFDAVNLDALYLVKLIFGKYFCYFDSNRVSASLQLQLYLDAYHVPGSERIKRRFIEFFVFDYDSLPYLLCFPGRGLLFL